METKEHKEAGDLVSLDMTTIKDNPYIDKNKDFSFREEPNKPFAYDPIKIQLMDMINGVPVPKTDNGKAFIVTYGDIVSLIGDYYDFINGYSSFQMPPKDTDPDKANQMLIETKVSQEELETFDKTVKDLTSSKVKKKDIDRIFWIDNNKYIPDLIKQLILSFVVPNYSEKLLNNEAHFYPWSLRAYIIGHQAALKSARTAYICKQMAAGETKGLTRDEMNKVDEQLNIIKMNPQSYKFDQLDREAVLKELANRYQAYAVLMEGAAQHYNSDHYAAGHSRVASMRKYLGILFGLPGSILINVMHNLDNKYGVNSTNTYISHFTSFKKLFRMIKEKFTTYGDDHYNDPENNESSDMLVNGMTSSLSDIISMSQKGHFCENSSEHDQSDYSGLSFLPKVDYCKRQTQPLLIEKDGVVYYRSDYKAIKWLSPSEYEQLRKDPASDPDYKPLTYWTAVYLSLKLRLFSSPKVISLENNPLREQQIAADEKRAQQKYDAQERKIAAQTIKANEVQEFKNHNKETKPVAAKAVAKKLDVNQSQIIENITAAFKEKLAAHIKNGTNPLASNQTETQHNRFFEPVLDKPTDSAHPKVLTKNNIAALKEGEETLMDEEILNQSSSMIRVNT